MDYMEKVKKLPLTPGVYLMKDSLGHVIYVGKAKQLKRRVLSYFQHSRSHPPKVKLMVRHIRDLEVIHTDTEFEAFLLECQLIKQLKPMYNKKMKNPQAYTYIALRTDNGRGHLELVYQPEPQRDELVLGPYTSRSTVERALHGIQETLGILCSHPHTVRSSLCLNHSLGLCNGMCAGGQALEDYHRLVDRMAAMLQGHDTGILDAMEERMVVAAERSDYETAARYRDELQAVQALLHKEKVIDFAAHHVRLAVLEPIDSVTLKLILLSGGQVVRERKLILGGADTGQNHLLMEIYEEIRACFGEEAASAAATGETAMSTHPPAASAVRPIGRDEIDEAQIIYSHLQKATCSYLSITDEWLIHREAAAEALAGLLEACPTIDE